MNATDTADTTSTSTAAFAYDAGWMCLDFANTADWHASEQPIETLRSYADLVAWSRGAGLLDDTAAAALLAAADAQPARAAGVLGRARRLREALYRVFAAHARGATAAPDDLSILNGALAEAHGRLRVAATPDGFAWTWAGPTDALDQLLWPIARSAGELLTAPELARVRECAGHPCGWLFLDTSRNHSRRWCSMAGCGNRAKARRHYERAKAAREREQGSGTRDERVANREQEKRERTEATTDERGNGA